MEHKPASLKLDPHRCLAQMAAPESASGVLNPQASQNSFCRPDPNYDDSQKYESGVTHNAT
jgi:hypothetical protein